MDGVDLDLLIVIKLLSELDGTLLHIPSYAVSLKLQSEA